MTEGESWQKKAFMFPYRVVKGGVLLPFRAAKKIGNWTSRAAAYSKKKARKILFGSFYNKGTPAFKDGVDYDKLRADYFAYYFYNKTGQIPKLNHLLLSFPITKDDNLVHHFDNIQKRMHMRENLGESIMNAYGQNLLDNFKPDGLIPNLEKSVAAVRALQAKNPQKTAPRINFLDRHSNVFRPIANTFGTTALGGLVPDVIEGDAREIVQNGVNQIWMEEQKKSAKRNRPVMKEIKDGRDYLTKTEVKYIINNADGKDDSNIWKDIGNNVTKGIISNLYNSNSTNGSFSMGKMSMGRGRSFWNNGYKRNYFNRGNYNYYPRRRRFNNRYYKKNFKKTWGRGRKYRKYFQRF